MSWSSSNAEVITVSPAGVVRALAIGNAVISGAVDGVSATVTITTTNPSLATLSVSAPPAVVYVGQSFQLTATGRDSVNAPLALGSLTWSSSNPDIATVSAAGMVTGIAAGTTTISAIGTTIRSVTATATVQVQLVPVARVVFDAPADTILHLRNPVKLLATAVDSVGNVLARPVTFSSSDVDVALATTDGVTAFNFGPVTITASAGGKSASQRFFAVPDSGMLVTTSGVAPGAMVQLLADVTSSAATEVRLANGGSPSRYLLPTIGGLYRLRAFDVVQRRFPKDGIFFTGTVLGVADATPPIMTTRGPPSTFTYLTLHPYTADVTAPAEATSSHPITVTWTFDAPSNALLSIGPNVVTSGAVAVFTSPPTRDVEDAFFVAPATVSRDASGRWKFTCTFTVISAPFTLYLQFLAPVPEYATGYLVYPSVARGETLYRIPLK